MKQPPRQHHRSAPVLGRSNVPPCMVVEMFQTAVRPSASCARVWVMPLGFPCLHPGGMRENSPAIYRWVKECEAISSPEGTEQPVSGHSFAPSGAWSVRDTLIPAINRWAIVDRPCGTGTAHVASNPSGIARGRAHSDSHSLGGGGAEMHWRHRP